MARPHDRHRPAAEMSEHDCLALARVLRLEVSKIGRSIERHKERHAAGESLDQEWLGRAEAALRHKQRQLAEVNLRLFHLLAAGANGRETRFVAAATAMLPADTLAEIWERVGP